MKTTFSITPIEEQDITGIVKVVNEAYQGEPGTRSWTSEGHLVQGSRTTAANVLHLFHQADTAIFKCTDDTGEILGCVVLERKPDTLYLGMLSVSPRTQASGIGSLLIEYGELYARTHNLSSVTITVIDRRKELIEWYQRKGFKLTGKQIPFSNQSSSSDLVLHLVELRKELPATR
ncbi:MAG: GNAT family N-acetyltransferase [Chitinophagaceae bacterium]